MRLNFKFRERGVILLSIPRFVVVMLILTVAAPKAMSFTDQQLSHFQEPSPTDNNMSILFMSINGVNIINGAEVGCFTPENVLAGAMEIRGPAPWGMAVWGDDSWTEGVIEGFRAGERLTFKYWHPVWDIEIDATAEVLEGDGDLVYTANDFFVLGLLVIVPNQSEPTTKDFSLTDVYPNPFNARARVGFTIPTSTEVNLSVYDINMRLVLKLEEGIFSAGVYFVEIDATSLQNGLYFIMLEAGREKILGRAVIIK